MALQLLPPPPNTALVDEPQRDSIWRRWLEQLFTRLSDAGQINHNTLLNLQGGTTNEYYHLTAAQHSTVTSFGTFNQNRVLFTSPTSTITTSGDLTYDSTISTLAAVNVSTLGTLTVGNASSDAFIINAGTWTYVSNWTANRVAGTVPTGVVNLTSGNYSATGDAGGASNIRGNNTTLNITGANNLTNATCLRYSTSHDGGGTITSGFGSITTIVITSTGSVTSPIAIQGGLDFTGSGGATTGQIFNANAPTITSTATILTLIGLRSANLGHATAITNSIGHEAANMTASVTLTASYRSQQNSGTGVWAYLHTGTANSAFNGKVRFGSGTVAPTEAVDITGALLASSSATALTFIPTGSTSPSNGMYLPAANELGWGTNSAKRLQLSSTGTFYGTALHNNAGPVTGTTNQYIASGTYTPTISSIANLDAVTSFAAQWVRVGNVVNVSGKVQIDPTAPATLTRLGFSLPIASNLANQEDCAGTAFATGIAGQGAGIRAEVTNDQAEMAYISGDVTVQPMMYIYQYEVL